MRRALTAGSFVVLLLATSSGCTRQYLVHNFPLPAARLRAPVQPEVVGNQDLGAGKPLFFTLNITAPTDSAVILVLHPRTRMRSLDRIIGRVGRRSVREWRGLNPTPEDRRFAPAIVSVYAERGKPNLVQSIDTWKVDWPAPQNWVVRTVIDRRHEQQIATQDSFLLVRPGEVVRIRIAATVRPDPSTADGEYRVRYQWITVPATWPRGGDCGRSPLVFEPWTFSPVTIWCEPIDGDGARPFEINAIARTTRINYWATAGFGVLFAGLVSAISFY